MLSDSLVLVLLAVVGVLLLLGLGLLALHVVGERSASTSPMPAAYRGEGTGAWRRGTLRVVAGRLVLKGPGGLARGPWQRGNLDLGVAGPLEPGAAQELGGEGLIHVPVSYGTSTFELALDPQHYTALRAWVEAVPPGWNSQVA